MKKWRLIKLGSTEISLHPAALIYWMYAFLVGHGLLMLVATLSILVHEIAHAVVSTALGYPPSSLELTPMGAVMRLEEEGRIPRGKQLLIFLAGPAATFLLSLTALHMAKYSVIPLQAGKLVFACNLSILMINVLPAAPLDGGRILATLLTILFPRSVVQKIMRGIGMVLGVALICLNIFISWHSGGWNLSLAFAGCCMLYCSNLYTTTQALAELRTFMDRKILLERNGCLEARPFCALGNTPIRQLIRILPTGRMAVFTCLENGSMRRIGTLTEHELIHLYLSAPELTLRKAIDLSQNHAEIAKHNTK